MKFANEIMDHEPVVVAPGLPVPELARVLLEKGVDGACVCKDGKLVGVVTTMDLIFQEKRVHLPTFVAIMDSVLPFGTRGTRDELEKITGSTVGDIMSKTPSTVDFDAPLDEVATLMVEGHFTIVPVLNGATLVGMITKKAVLLAIYEARRG